MSNPSALSIALTKYAEKRKADAALTVSLINGIAESVAQKLDISITYVKLITSSQGKEWERDLGGLTASQVSRNERQLWATVIKLKFPAENIAYHFEAPISFGFKNGRAWIWLRESLITDKVLYSDPDERADAYDVVASKIIEEWIDGVNIQGDWEAFQGTAKKITGFAPPE